VRLLSATVALWAGSLAVAAGSGLAVGAPHTRGQAQPQGDGAVLVTRVDDTITPVIADHVGEVVARGGEGGHEAVVVEMDTPGGLDSSMRDIVQDLLGADVPVVVHVTPSGARAASAGALIAWSAHVVAMAPGTTIGAATPVDLEGGEVGDKVVNDAAAYARAVAEERGRNVEVAAEAVTGGRALSAREAVDEDVADLEVTGRGRLLDALDGRRVTLADGTTTTLRTAGAEVVEDELSPLRRVLQWLADPNLAFLFLSLGVLALLYELASPGLGVAGGVGTALVLLGLLALAVLPINAVGFVFLGVAVALLVAELFAPGIGVAAALGSAFLVLAGLVLFRDEAPGASLSLAAVVPTAVVVGLAAVVAGRLVVRSRHVPAWMGPGTLIGRELVVARAEGTSGQGMVEGAWWHLRSDQPLEEGDHVRVRDIDGLDLLVAPAPRDGPDDGTPSDRPGGKPDHKEDHP
jgi:membrane-bound serine protease (ClpP class)